jgi:hypothetical protein
VLRALERRGLLDEYQHFVLTPDMVRRVLDAAGVGLGQQMFYAVDQAAQVLTIVESDLSVEDRKYFSGLIVDLLEAIALR